MKKKLYWFIKHDGLGIVFSLIVFLVLIVVKINNATFDFSIVDFTIFYSIVAAMLLSMVSKLLSPWFINRLEDDIKLSTDYNRLIKRYPSTVFGEVLLNYKNITIPVVEIMTFNNESIKLSIIDSKEMYVLPNIVKDHYDELFKSHETSNLYNQLNVRVRNWIITNDQFILETMRTTYFDSMVTNRAMDFKWNNELTTRDVFQYGPFISPLSESKLSNHLGFNGFIIFDSHIPFVLRNGIVSIGKRTVGASVMASLKTKYALNADGEFTLEGLRKAILNEITDELYIPAEVLTDFDLDLNIVSAYRDMVEGGKPQLLFYYNVPSFTYDNEKVLNTKKIENVSDFTTLFNKLNKQSKKKQQKNKSIKELIQEQDGTKLIWLNIKNINNTIVSYDTLKINGKKYRAMPSTVASLILLISSGKLEGINNSKQV